LIFNFTVTFEKWPSKSFFKIDFQIGRDFLEDRGKKFPPREKLIFKLTVEKSFFKIDFQIGRDRGKKFPPREKLIFKLAVTFEKWPSKSILKIDFQFHRDCRKVLKNVV